MAICGALATIADESFSAGAFLTELEERGLKGADGRLALEKAVMEGFVRRLGDGRFVKLERAHLEAVPGRLATP